MIIALQTSTKARPRRASRYSCYAKTTKVGTSSYLGRASVGDLSHFALPITPPYSRAARGLLNWNQNQLAEAAHIGGATIRRFEAGRRTPVYNNLMAIRRANGSAGSRHII